MLDSDLFKRMSEAKILVVGDVMLDRYWYGDSQRISPEAPVPVVKVGDAEDKVGGAANVARNLAHLDTNVTLMGIVGEDDNAVLMQRMLDQDDIHAELVSQSAQPTIAKLRVISRQQQVVRLDFEEKFSENASALLLERFKDCIAEYAFVIFSDYAKGSLAKVSEMISVAKSAGAIVLVDPKEKDLSAYRGADFITPNLKEYREAGGHTGSEEIIADSARNILDAAGIQAMLLTRSEEGMSGISLEEKFDLAAQKLEVADVTGAGDTVIATLAASLASGLSFEDAAKLANYAAGVVVSKLGAATVSQTELAKATNQDYFSRLEIQASRSEEDALRHIRVSQAAGEKIVFTNGCFDILHAGHVQYLEKAKALGDRLVVGLNNDASVSRLKGPSRPLNDQFQRQRVLLGLAAVDWVVPFGEVKGDKYDDTPYELISKVQPDILVKGGDYKIEDIVGGDFVVQQGGQVKTIEFLDGCSTSGIVEKIIDRSQQPPHSDTEA